MSQDILYIEDNPINIRLIEKYLKPFDFKLTSEYHANAGIRRALINQPDLIIVDVNLPDDSGMSVIQQLRQMDKTQHTPIIALTAMDNSRVERQCLDAGADIFLGKPINRQTLIDNVSQLLQVEVAETRR